MVTPKLPISHIKMYFNGDDIAIRSIFMINRYFLTMLIITFGGTACSQEMSPTPSSGAPDVYPTATVGVSMSATNTNAFFQDMYNSFKSAGEEQASITLLLDEANNNQNRQYQQLDDMIAKGAKALVVNMVDVSQGEKFVKKYCDKNIPVVYINRSPGEKNMAQCHTAYFVDGDANQAGVIQGLTVLESWQKNPAWDKNNDGKIQYAMLEGLPGHAGAMARTKWSVGTMQNYPTLGVPVQKVFQDYAMFNKEKASELIESWIADPNFANVEVLLANNDNMAIGAIETLKQHNIELPVFGIDAGEQGKELVKSGDMEATVFNDYDNQARVALRMAANLAAEKPVMEGIDYRLEYSTVNVPYQEIDVKNN